MHECQRSSEAVGESFGPRACGHACAQLEVHEAKAMLDNHPQWDIPDTEEEDEEQEDSDGIEESEDGDDEDDD